ncbi:PTS transporter subunit EIIC [Listeria booriae]|uniref:PTS transporter subunit EIIC n=1 Tax=Listeria booriae TaxID=1552123 RepID=A0A7X1CGE4_9LIST|nr:beta-glucoside-specific PTS transporter subunit IIABC [Listeria booriae]MBC1317921.1 PTS transporter subunit EIIC [Listeria booriae]MBC1563367.1 PTS transporter subunit EIIC [Listeria booriae]MBC1798226.1 PTS transporter subunit EIIC [Listeria booriae]MBC1801464.1 PTS transporter subunit EIIC [Listeria booriae]MBC1889539.1 PTS transporter subunit EIIC [Listeria booriae]
MKYEQLAKDILDKVGGTENINSVFHCITRLRFKLKDESIAKTAELEKMDGVISVLRSGGQYQVVIGNHVPDVYKAVLEVGGISAEGAENSGNDSGGNLFNRFIDMISGVFTPVLGVLAATGMIKGFASMFLAFGWVTQTSGTYQIMYAIGDALFYFFPIFLGYTAIKKFGGNIFVGMAIGGALVYPALAGLTAGKPMYTLFAGTMFESPIHITFLGIPVILMSYASSVIPIILATFFAAKVEKGLKKIIPDVVKTFLVPFFTLLIVVPLTFIVIGPIAVWAGDLLGHATLWVYNLSPVIAGILLGGFWQVFVIFGLHWGLIPVAINNLTTLHADPILAMTFGASFAQIGAVLAVMLKTKNQKIKTLGYPAFISGIFGVTEPAIYGITLPLKKPFIMSCIGGAVGGGIIGYAGAQAYIMGGLGIFGLPNFIKPGSPIDGAFWWIIIAIVVSFILGLVLTYVFGFKDPVEASAAAAPVVTEGETLIEHEVLVSPLQGELIPLVNVKDEAFSSGALGKGLGIVPTEGKLFAPASGTVTMVFPTGHALGITTDSGAEILMHVGMDTVQLEGKYFKVHVKQGDKITQGQLLTEFDVEGIKSEGYDITTPIIVTNTNQYLDVMVVDETEVKPGDRVITLVI